MGSTRGAVDQAAIARGAVELCLSDEEWPWCWFRCDLL
jgi:hypothetical protein